MRLGAATTRDMTSGSIAKQILLFSLPLMLGNIFQMLYNTVDSIVVGNFVGKEALAAVGSTTMIVNMMVFFFNGFSVGAGVVIARYFGARDMERLLTLALEDAGLPYGGLTGEALVSPRRGGGLMLVEYAGKEAEYQIEGTMEDILTGETFEGHVPLTAYQARVLKRKQ